MSLMGTLAKMAVGYAAARGIDAVSQGGGLQGMLSGRKAPLSANDPAAQAQAQMTGTAQSGGNPLQDMMSQMTGGNFDISSMLGGGGAGGGAGGGLGGLLGGAAGGAGLGGILAAAAGALQQGGQQAGAVADQFAKVAPQPETEALAGLMLRAMIMAAKSDGDIDESEQAKIMEAIGDADESDIQFVNDALAAPVDPEGLGAEVSPPLRAQVYAAALMTVRLDTNEEAQFLHRLATSMSLDEATVNGLHLQMGQTPLYG